MSVVDVNAILVKELEKTDNKLYKDVISDILDQEDPYNYLLSIEYGGGQSGVITSLIYTVDCSNFVKEHLEEVLDIVNEYTQEYGALNGDLSVSFLAWLSYEKVAQDMLNIVQDEIYNAQLKYE